MSENATDNPSFPTTPDPTAKQQKAADKAAKKQQKAADKEAKSEAKQAQKDAKQALKEAGQIIKNQDVGSNVASLLTPADSTDNPGTTLPSAPLPWGKIFLTIIVPGGLLVAGYLYLKRKGH